MWKDEALWGRTGSDAMSSEPNSYFPPGEGGKGRAEQTPWVRGLVGPPGSSDIVAGHALPPDTRGQHTAFSRLSEY